MQVRVLAVYSLAMGSRYASVGCHVHEVGAGQAQGDDGWQLWSRAQFSQATKYTSHFWTGSVADTSRLVRASSRVHHQRQPPKSCQR